MTRRRILQGFVAGGLSPTLNKIEGVQDFISPSPEMNHHLAERFVKASCSLDAETRTWLRWGRHIRLDPADLSTYQKRQISRFADELLEISRHPDTTLQIQRAARSLRVGVQKITSLTPAATSRRDIQQREQAPKQNQTLKPTRRAMIRDDRQKKLRLAQQAKLISSRGLSTALLMSIRLATLAGGLLVIDPLGGDFGEEYLKNNGEKFHEYLDLPEERQKFLLASNDRLLRYVEKSLRIATENTGGIPRNLSCESGHLEFFGNPSGAHSSRRRIKIFKNDEGAYHQIQIFEYAGGQLLYGALVVIDNYQIQKIVPSFPQESRQFSHFNQAFTKIDFQNAIANQLQIGAGKFLFDISQADLYLSLIENKLINCDTDTENSAPEAKPLTPANP